MRTRILIGVGAWLLGAVTATGGSLLAVSQLGQGLVDNTGQQLTVSAVNSALAAEQAEQAATVTPRPRRTIQPARAAHRAAAARRHKAATTSPSPSPSPSPPPPGTLLASSGGTVLATCLATGAYLLSWSPQQGFEAQDVVRGPAALVSVRFDAQFHGVTMRVTCRGGVPTAQESGWGGDDGEGGDD